MAGGEWFVNWCLNDSTVHLFNNLFYRLPFFNFKLNCYLPVIDYFFFELFFCTFRTFCFS